MKYYNITVNGVAYSVSVEETAAGAAPVAAVLCVIYRYRKTSVA